MTSIVEWLESPEGEAWSREQHNSIPGHFVTIKDDFEVYPIGFIFTSVSYNAENYTSSIR